MANKLKSITFPDLSGAYDVSSTFDETTTVTVGTGGDYTTLGEAITALSEKYPIYAPQGLGVYVKILSGTVINEQIAV